MGDGYDRAKKADEPVIEDVRVRPGPPPMRAEVKAETLARLARGRTAAARAEWAARRQANAALLEADPLSHLQRFRRNEWRVLEVYLADPRVDMKQVAARLGYSDWRSIQQILKKPRVQKFIQQVRAAQVEAIIKGDFGAQALLKQSQVKAAQKVVATIDDPGAGAKTNLAAAESVLDRTGLGKASAVQHHHVHEILRHFTPEEMEAYGMQGVVPERFKTVFAQLEGPTDS